MKRAFLFTIMLFATALLGNTELVIQQGLNGYSGFYDRMESNNDFDLEVEEHEYIGTFNYTCWNVEDKRIARSAINLNLSNINIPANAHVKSATLSLYRLGSILHNEKINYKLENEYGQDNTIEILPLTGPIDNTVTDLETLEKKTSKEILYWYDHKMNKDSKLWIDFDITSEMVDFLKNPNDFHGFCIRNHWIFTNQGGKRTWAGGSNTFVSSNNTEYVNERPKLTLTLTYDDYVTIDDNSNLDKVAYQHYPYIIKWATNSQEAFTIELLKDGNVIETIAENQTGNSYTWDVPLTSPVGNGYKLKISNKNCSYTISDNLTIRENSPIKEYPYIMTFDSLNVFSDLFKYYWNQKTSLKRHDTEFGWTSHKGGTPSRAEAEKIKSWIRPGPKDGLNGGKYLYTEGDGNLDKLATLYSPLFDLSKNKDATMEFWYHLNTVNGSDKVGDLYVDVNINGEWTQNIFHKGGNQGDKWKKAVIDLSPYNGKVVQFAFRAKHKNSEYCDIALDDFKVTGATQIGKSGAPLIDNATISYNSSNKTISIINNSNDFTKVSLISLSGRNLLSKDFAKDNLKIDLHNYNISNGVYVLVFESNNIQSRNYPIIIK